MSQRPIQLPQPGRNDCGPDVNLIRHPLGFCKCMVWYGMVPLLRSYPPSVCSVTEGGGVMQRGPIRSLGSVSNTDRQFNPRLFGDGFVLVTLAMEKKWNRGCLHQTKL
jgi:hypothetical protein